MIRHIAKRYKDGNLIIQNSSTDVLFTAIASNNTKGV